MNHATILFAAVLATPVLLPGQQLPEGLQSTVQTLPASAGNVLELPQGRVAFDGQDLTLTPAGQPPQVLLHLAAPVFGSFTIAVGGNAVLFGENSTDGIWLVPLQGPPPTAPIASLLFNYDAALLSPQRALVSGPGGSVATGENELVVIDLTNGQSQLLARLPGASGPVAVAANGDVYYATAGLAFPPPPGACSVVRLRANVVAHALQTATVLGPADTELVFAGLDVAADLVLDDDGDLLFVDWLNNQVGELNDATGPAPTLAPPLLTFGAGAGAVALQFVPATTGGVFEPFQPVGGELLVHESDFFAVNRLRSLRAAPAVLTASAASPIPSGACALSVAGGPANGLGVLALALQQVPGTLSLVVPGFEAPLAWSLALTAPVTVVVPIDAAGAMSFAFTNPGFAPALPATAQVLFLTAAGGVGATAPLPVSFGQ
jgi:hypothetical protein